jgi:thiamine biosynthesis protein ThiS
MKACALSCAGSSCQENNCIVTIEVNGESKEFPNELTVESLISILSLEPTRVAIELNRNVVRRSDWSQTVLRNEDRVEIVHFVGGGSLT